jgi:hypothetical protein
MATEKTFDKADLLRFFVSGEEATVGKITVITPNRTLFGETDTTRYPVAAKTEALWCEKYRLAMLVQSVDFPDGGRAHLPKNHPLRQEPTVQVKYGGNSAQLVRWAMEMADAWHSVIRWMLPSDPIDLTKRITEPTEPEAPIDQDHTPTGTSIDDPFEDGEAQA